MASNAMSDNTSNLVTRSIENNLNIALILMSILVLFSSAVAWLAFNKIDAGQEALLSKSLPSMRLVGNAVDDGLELLDIGATIDELNSLDALNTTQNRMKSLVEKINDEMRALSMSGGLDSSSLEVLEANTDALVSNLQQQFLIKSSILETTLLLNDLVADETKLLEAILIDIKLLKNRLSESSLNDKSIESQSQSVLGALVELRFNIQQLRSIAAGVQYLTEIDQVKKRENDYRIIIGKASNAVAGFEPATRKVLIVGLSEVRGHFLSKEKGIFSLAVNRLELKQNLLKIQSDNLLLSEKLIQKYKKTSESSSFNVDQRARSILRTTAHSKIILLVVVVVSLLIVFLFSLFFIKPKIINRLRKLTANTRSIASNVYDIKIDAEGNDEIAAMASSLAYFRDELVEKKSFQKKLEDREKALSTILNNTVEGLFTVDVAGVIRTFNPASEVFFDAKADEVLGRHVNCLLPEDIEVFTCHQFRSIGEDGDGYVVCQEKDVIAQDNNGKTFFGRLSVSLLNLSGNQAYSCFLRDVSSEYEARERIDNLVEQLMRSNSDLEQFAYSCSHDLQEPVRMVLSFSELLENNIKDKLDENSAKYLHYIRQGAKSAKQLIKDMLDYSRLDQAITTKEWVTLEQLCKKVQELTMVTRGECHGDLRWTNGDLNLYAIPSQLVQLLTNLVTNGLKYNESQERYVAICGEEKEESWLLSVSDNGIGIDSRYNKKIFEVFSRLVSKRDYDGSGIGLSICQKVAEKHGGTIWVESELGKGSQFFISLPKDSEE